LSTLAGSAVHRMIEANGSRGGGTPDKRPGFFDLAAVRETVSTARELNKPYAVVINAAPVKREDQEAAAAALSRAQPGRGKSSGRRTTTSTPNTISN
jgi:hypothetical protein